MVGDAPDQVLRGYYAVETTLLVENWYCVDPFLQHDSGDFTDLCRGSCRDYPRGHDRGNMLQRSLSRIAGCDQFRDMLEKISIREHPDECAMY